MHRRPPVALLAAGLALLTMLALPPTPAAADVGDASHLLAFQNELRASVGLPSLPGDERLTMAAQRHADYSARNGTEGHFEEPGSLGFTGATPRDRIAAAGWGGGVVSEVATPLLKGAFAGVRQIWDAPYHRLALLHPNAIAAGWGHSGLGGRERTVGDLAFDMARSAAEFVRSPANGQTGIPTSWDNMEIPSPIPAGAGEPVGYPIMVVYAGGRRVDLRGVELVAPDGGHLPLYVGPQYYQRDYQVVVPRQPLPDGTTLHVRFDLTVDGAFLTNEWDFTTAGVPADLGYHARWVSQSAYPVLAPGETSAPLTVSVANTGSRAWVRGADGGQLNLGAAAEVLGSLAVDWPAPDRVAIQNETVVRAGDVATFTFRVRAPPVPGSYLLRLRPVIDGTAWLEDEGVYLLVVVRSP